MFIDWWYEEYNPGDMTRPEAPTRQIQRKRRKSRFEVLVQFLVPAGLMGLVFWNLYIGLPLHTWLIMLGTVLLYFVVSFAVCPVEHPDLHNLPNTLLNHPFRLARTKHGIQRILALFLTPGWLMSKTIVRLFTLLRYATVQGKQADQLYYSTNLSVDKWWVLPGLVMIAASVTFAIWSLTWHLVYEKYSRDAGEADAHVIRLALLFFFGGALGLHRFYTDRILTGVLYMCTMGLFGVGLIYDGVLLVFGGFDTS